MQNYKNFDTCKVLINIVCKVQQKVKLENNTLKNIPYLKQIRTAHFLA